MDKGGGAREKVEGIKLIIKSLVEIIRENDRKKLEG